MARNVRRVLRFLIGLGMILTAVFGLKFARLSSEAANSVTLITWGSNGNGQLGRPNPPGNLVPGSVVDFGSGSGTIAVTGGSAHSLALKSDGAVLAWGSNSSGQLGDGTTISRLVPTPVSGLGPSSGVVAVSAGNAHNLALLADGTVLAWGLNSNGQLGDGTSNAHFAPNPVSGLGAGSGVIAIAAGFSHSLALKSDGTVLAWGLNSNGQLGDGTTTQRTTPVEVFGLGPNSGVVAVSAGSSHSLVRKQDGTVWSWGANSTGQLGDGTTTQKSVPVAVTGLAGVMTIAAGNSHSLALRVDGTVWGWGSNSSGQLGDGTFSQRTTPVQVIDPSTAGFLTGGSTIAAGSLYSLAVKADGTVLGWGANSNGQLGDGTTTLRLLPVEASGLASGSGVVKIAGGNTHSLALKSDGTLLSWGSNTNGQLGKGIFDGSPLSIGGLTDIVSIASGAGGSHNLARKSDGSVLSWGFNLSGQLGDGTTSAKNMPVQVNGMGTGSGVVALAAGTSHSLALKSDGAVWAWGSNSNGQLGDGTTSMKTSPIPLNNLGAGSGVVALAAGTSHSLALKSDGTVWAWGLNSNGQLGDGTLVQRIVPVQVKGPGAIGFLTDVLALAAGGSYSLALKSDGTVWAWGMNSSGQLGDGTSTQRTTPVQVRGIGGSGFLTGVSALAAGTTHSLALISDGRVLAWGSNTAGQLGDGTTTLRNTPGQVVNLMDGNSVISIAGGAAHSLAVKSNSSVWSWGNNSSGQLGDGSLESRVSPVQSLVAGVTRVTAGSSHSVAIAASTDTTMPSITVNIAGALGQNGWYRSDVTVTWIINDPESAITSSTGCEPVNLIADTPEITLTCTAVNTAGLTGSASITLKIDKSVPFVSFTRTPGNANGWNNGPVLVRFNAEDTLAGLNGPALIEQNFASEGQNQTASATFTDLAGNTVTATVNGINIDITVPTLQFGPPSPLPNAAGWHNNNVSVGFTAADNLSSVFSTSLASPLLLASEGSSVSRTVIVTDAAGNSATFVSPAVKIDKTPPAASANASPLPDPNGWNTTPVTVSFTGTDNLSGLAVCSQAVVLNTNGQNQSASGTCTDTAGNMSPPATVTGININMSKAGPQISGMPPPNCIIWPVNRRLVTIANIKAADPSTGDPATSLSIQVTSNEPVNASDIVVSGGVVQVRADRSGNGSGRIYTVVARATDVAGNSSEATGSCTVPHDMSR